MRLLADERSALDQALLSAVSEKARAERLGEEDLDHCFALFAMVCNHVDDLRLELDEYSQSYQFDLDGRHYAVVFDRGRCTAHAGETTQPDITMQMSLPTILGLLDGAVNAGVAHMNGEISCRGTKNGSARLQSVFELFLDELGV